MSKQHIKFDIGDIVFAITVNKDNMFVSVVDEIHNRKGYVTYTLDTVSSTYYEEELYSTFKECKNKLASLVRENFISRTNKILAEAELLSAFIKKNDLEK